jgi:spermidine synthase
MAIRVEKLLEEYQSPYQHIAIYDSTHHGKILVLDGFIQMTVADNFCYHEMITHVPMAVSQEEPNSVLVIGGGDGGVVNQLGKYQSLERIVWIDIDAAVVDLCRKYMPELHRFHDERVEFIAMDGADIDYQAEFDLIIVDGTDPIGGGESLWSKKFYTGLASALKPNGVITALGFWMWPDPHVYLRTRKMAEAHFEHTHYYWFLDPSMRYGYMGVILMTNNPLDPTVPQHLERVPAGLTEYYNGTVHTAAFALPNCFRPEAAFVPAEE